MKQQMNGKIKVKALTIAVAVALSPLALAGTNVDSISGTQSYAYADSSGTPYTAYDFTGSNTSDKLQIGSGSTYGPLVDGSIVMSGISMANNSTYGPDFDYLDWQAGGQPSNRLVIEGSAFFASGSGLFPQPFLKNRQFFLNNRSKE